jgi:polyisoprenoid-binding protein YceI
LMISKVRGAFESFTARIEVPEGSKLPTAVTVEIDANSIDTRVADRDNHLRSADFLDVANHPKLTFTGTKISGNESAFTIEGDLTIRGTTRPVTLKAEFEGGGKDPWGNERIAYSASTKISRKEFGLTWNQALEAGGVAVGDEVDISVQVEAVKAQAAAAV